jgi:hypothetical protein
MLCAAIISSAGAVLAALIVGLPSYFTEANTPQPSSSPTARLALASLTATSVPDSYSSSGSGKIALRSETLDFELRNIGSQLAVITAVKIKVLRIVRVDEVHSNWISASPILPVSATYPAELHAWLSVKQKAGQLVTVPTSEQVKADGPDNFEVNVTLPREVITRDSHCIKYLGCAQPFTYVYLLNVSVAYDGSQELKAGNVIIALPLKPRGSLAKYLRSP